MHFCLTLVTIVSETSIISVELISHITTIVELSASYGTHCRFIAYFQKARRIRIARSLYSISPLVDLFMFFIKPRTRRRRFNGGKYVW